MKRVHLIAVAALFSVLAAGGAALADTPAEAPVAGTCQVTVDRSQAADSFRVDKQQLENGNCVCYVYTGSETQGAETEAKVADVQKRRDCGGAPLADAVLPDAGSRIGMAAASGGLVILGIVAALSGDGHGHQNDSTGG